MLGLNSERYLEYQLAVPWGGGVLTPCNVRWSVAELAHSLKDSRSTILIFDEAFQTLVERIRRAAPCLRELVYAGDAGPPLGMHGYEALLAGAEPIPDARRQGDDLLGIFYTGGTSAPSAETSAAFVRAACRC